MHQCQCRLNISKRWSLFCWRGTIIRSIKETQSADWVPFAINQGVVEVIRLYTQWHPSGGMIVILLPESIPFQVRRERWYPLLMDYIYIYIYIFMIETPIYSGAWMSRRFTHYGILIGFHWTVHHKCFSATNSCLLASDLIVIVLLVAPVVKLETNGHCCLWPSYCLPELLFILIILGVNIANKY